MQIVADLNHSGLQSLAFKIKIDDPIFCFFKKNLNEQVLPLACSFVQSGAANLPEPFKHDEKVEHRIHTAANLDQYSAKE